MLKVIKFPMSITQEAAQPTVITVQAQAQQTQSIIDSLLIRWGKTIITLVIIPLMLAGVYKVFEKVDSHSDALSGIVVSVNDIKHSIDDVKQAQKDLNTTVANLAEKQNLDENNIAGLQQSDLDRRAPSPVAAPIEPTRVETPRQHERHSAARPQPNFLTAIAKLLNPSQHGIRARAEVK